MTADQGPQFDQSQEARPDLLMAQLPIPVTLQQLELYQTRREFMYMGRGTEEYEERVRQFMIGHPDQVTDEWILGESGGTGKEHDAAQRVADRLFNPKFRAEALEKTGKLPRPFYLSLGTGIQYLRKIGEIGDYVKHPDYTLTHFDKAWLLLAQVVSLAKVSLPRMYPETINDLIMEFPFTLVGNAMVVGPNTHVKVRMTIPQAQEEAAKIRDTYSSLAVDYRPADAFSEFGDYIDNPHVEAHDISWNMGNRESAAKGTATMDNWMVETSQANLLGIPPFTAEQLKDPEFRNLVALPAYYQYRLTEDWRIPAGQWHLAEGHYLPNEKYYFQALLYAYSLSIREVLNYGYR